MKDWADERPFNMDALFLDRINNRLDELDKATEIGDQLLRYRVMKVIFMDTFFKYEDNKDDMDAAFAKIKAALSVRSATISGAAQHQQMVLSQVENDLDDLSFILMKLLYENDLIYLKKKINLTPEQEVAEDFQ